MRKTLTSFLAALFLAFGCAGNAARADWPAKVFAPYTFIQRAGSQLTDAYNATGQKYFTLAFMNSNAAGEPAWDSGAAVSTHFYADQIAAIRAKRGDVIVSFGGDLGQRTRRELGLAEPDPVKLQAKYQSIIDEYKFTWFDFDLEANAIADPAVNHRRNTALAALQKANPGLIIVFTFAGHPEEGITPRGLDILKDAKAQGVKVTACNVMTMDFPTAQYAGHNMGDLTITAANTSYKQCQAIDPDMQIGITEMIGRNDRATDMPFMQADTTTIADWGTKQSWVRLFAFWELGRDRKGNSAAPAGPATRPRAAATSRAGRARGAGGGGGGIGRGGSGVAQNDWDFTNGFKLFTIGFTPATQP